MISKNGSKKYFLRNTGQHSKRILYSPFCVPAKVIKFVGLRRPPFLSPTNLITFAVTQNGE